MHNFHENPNQVKGDDPHLIPRGVSHELEKNKQHVIFTMWQTTSDNNIELKDDVFVRLNLSNIESAISAQIVHYLKPSIFTITKLRNPIKQSILFIENRISNEKIPVLALELNMVTIFFPHHKTKRIKSKTRYAVVVEDENFVDLLKRNNLSQLSNELQQFQHSEDPNLLQRFKYHLLKL